MRSLRSPRHQHLSDVVFCFLHAAFKVDLLLLEDKHTVSWWAPLGTMHTMGCDSTSSSLIFSSFVLCVSVRLLLISSFDLRMNLNDTQASASPLELYSPRHSVNYAGCHGDSHASNSFVQPRVVRQRGHFHLRESSMFLIFRELIDLQVC